MALTDEQLATFAFDLHQNTDPDVQAWLASGNHEAIADWYNVETESPDVFVFKSRVTRVELIASMAWAAEYDPDPGPGFKSDMPAIDFIVDPVDGYDPRPVESRNALNAVFAGAGTSKAQILTQAVRICSRAEKLFIEPTTGPGGGNGSAANNAAIAVFEGLITSQDVLNATKLFP